MNGRFIFILLIVVYIGEVWIVDLYYWVEGVFVMIVMVEFYCVVVNILKVVVFNDYIFSIIDFNVIKFFIYVEDVFGDVFEGVVG